MVSNDGVVFQRPCHGVGNAVVPQVFRYSIQRLNAAGVLVLVVPLFQLFIERLGVLFRVGNIVHARQRLVQLVILILGFRLIILLL